MKITIRLFRKRFLLFKEKMITSHIYKDGDEGLIFDMWTNEKVLRKSKNEGSMESKLIEDITEIHRKMNEIKENPKCSLTKGFELRSLLILDLKRIANDYNLIFEYDIDEEE